MQEVGRTLVYFGHSAFLIKSSSNVNILIDPWISNPINKAKIEEFTNRVHYILITHGHDDHVGDTLSIAKAFDAEVITNHEIANFLHFKGLNKLTGMNTGGTYRKDNLSFTMVEATHSSTIHDGERMIPGGNPVGFVVTLEDGYKLYHMGDTGLLGSLPMIAELYKPDILMIPIGGHYTMGPQEAAYTVSIIKPKVIIPMHYKTFPLIDVNLEEFIEKLSPAFKDRVIPLKPGDSYSF
ncbi:MAG TPA: metal-dependent hydrolase [Candidatus Hydrothermia bacterium]|nr:metal-dependent hydrolase [Candidatus Hydrothermia bacterium]HOK23563.1 metal-dependent hydrolase [Candidatus Hydrothermia bacterium]HOL24288.1 metal-dependent hydrolase [Candidatus Hydrothermia bacterium]HOP33140.1 metal-dependent hydrolase [Candidatus Hydrothermia bacterium]HPO79274.1 metal-dependent hydrolase [Candidatus Hydrothermia bacterium]